MKELHLICESHIDPIWLWSWEEGAAEAISTFQSAVNLLDEFDYIFCHNEVTLYRYIQEYAPDLFARIQQLVKEGRWHIMGGWHLQPDCHMPHGESIVRHALTGRMYFQKYFNSAPTTAINFDAFGHSRGMVQIVKRCGQDSYIFVRPFAHELELPAEFFTWRGFDGSEISAFRSPTYNSLLFGKAIERIRKFKAAADDNEIWLCLWGVGNHGGGPSRLDLQRIEEFKAETETQIIHSTPEAFFAKAKPTAVVEKSLHISMPGCYSTASEYKRRHIEMENSLLMAEKQMSLAAISGLCEYPEKEFEEAVDDLMDAEFHDLLPGTSVKKGMAVGFRMLDHGLRNLEKIRARAFFAMVQNEPRAGQGEYPVFVFNALPYKRTENVEVEFNLANQNHDVTKTSRVHLYDGDQEIPCQLIREDGNILLDWRKRLIFRVELEPLAVKRLRAEIEFVPTGNKLPENGKKISAEMENFSKDAEKTEVEYVTGEGRISQPEGDFIFDNGEKYVRIDRKTGLLASYRVKGKEYLTGPAFAPYLYEDTADAWALQTFQLKGVGCNPVAVPLSQTNGGVFRGRKALQVVEDGKLVYAVECLFESEHVGVRVLYNIYKEGTGMDVKVNVLWNEKERILKMHIPTIFKNGSYTGQTMYGTDDLFTDGRECTAQRFVSIGDHEDERLAILNNCLYASSCQDGEIRLSLLRSPLYSGMPQEAYGGKIGPDRYAPVVDRGEHEFAFRMDVCPAEEMERRALEFNQPSFALNMFPTGGRTGKAPVRIEQSNPNVSVITIKKGEMQDGYVIRLFNGTGKPASTRFAIGDSSTEVSFGPYEVKSLVYQNGAFTLLEELVI